MALITPGDIDNWIGRSVGSERQDEVTSCIAFSQQWIANQAGLRSLEKESAPVVAYFDSEDAWGCDLWIPMSLRPMWHTGSTLVTITENGTTLTSAIGYSTTAGVTLRGVNSFERVRLTRLGGWGSSYVGANNIALTCTCGFDGASGATTNPLPPDVKRP